MQKCITHASTKWTKYKGCFVRCSYFVIIIGPLHDLHTFSIFLIVCVKSRKTAVVFLSGVAPQVQAPPNGGAVLQIVLHGYFVLHNLFYVPKPFLFVCLLSVSHIYICYDTLSWSWTIFTCTLVKAFILRVKKDAYILYRVFSCWIGFCMSR